MRRYGITKFSEINKICVIHPIPYFCAAMNQDSNIFSSGILLPGNAVSLLFSTASTATTTLWG